MSPCVIAHLTQAYCGGGSFQVFQILWIELFLFYLQAYIEIALFISVHLNYFKYLYYGIYPNFSIEKFETNQLIA